MAKTYRQKIGHWGETIALQWLTNRGYVCLERNVYSAHGELDLIMLKEDVYYFIEVKTRRNDTYGLAEFSMTRKKIAALLRAINQYLHDKALDEVEWQLDLIVVEKFEKDQEPEILHFERLGEYDD